MIHTNVLVQLGIAEFGYVLENIGQSELFGKYIMTLRKQGIGSSSQLDNGESVRVIALEPNNTPILACISCTGHIREINEYGRSVVIEVNQGQPSQLRHFPIVLLKTDVDLTKRELSSIDFIHRIGGRRQEIALALLGEQ